MSNSPRFSVFAPTCSARPPMQTIVHIELQSSNDAGMIWRMAEYAFAIRRRFGRWPFQCVLYAGYEPLRMRSRIDDEAIAFECRMVDFRELEAEPLLAGGRLDDSILAVLTRLTEERAAVKKILERIARSEPAQRVTAIRELTILAGLRKLGTVISEEAAKMPILDDIMDHDLLGPAIRRGMEQGREEGRHEGREEGRHEGREE